MNCFYSKILLILTFGCQVWFWVLRIVLSFDWCQSIEILCWCKLGTAQARSHGTSTWTNKHRQADYQPILNNTGHQHKFQVRSVGAYFSPWGNTGWLAIWTRGAECLCDTIPTCHKQQHIGDPIKLMLSSILFFSFKICIFCPDGADILHILLS